jgi:hypothetical protein
MTFPAVPQSGRTHGSAVSSCLRVVCVCAIFLQNNVTTARAALPTGEEITVQLSVQRQGYTIIPAVLVGNDVYLPVIDIFNYLKIKIDVAKGMRTLSGFFISEDVKYVIDIDKGFIKNGNTTVALVREDVIFSETNVFLRRSLFKQAFGLDCAFFYRSLEVQLTTDLTLPFISDMMRERLRQNMQRVDNENIIADRYLLKKHSWLQGAMLDWAVQNSITRDADVLNYSLAAGMEVLGGDLNTYLTGSNQAAIAWDEMPWEWRYVANHGKWFRQATIGHLTAIPFATQVGAMNGIRISNSPPVYRRAFGTYQLSDYTQPEWIVELYVNQQLVDFVKSDASGHYQFSIPLSYGPTNVMLKFYGPWGEERSMEKFIEIPYSFLPSGAVEYSLVAGRIDAPVRKDIAQLTMQAGLHQRLTVGGGIQYLTDQRATPFATAGYRILDEMMVTGEFYDRSVARGLLSYAIGTRLNLELGYSRFVRESPFNYSGVSEIREATLSFPFNVIACSGFARVKTSQNIFATARDLTTEAVLSLFIRGVQVTLTGDGQWFSSTDLESQFHRGSAAVAFRLPWDIQLRSQMEYNISRREFTALRVQTDRQVPDVGWFSFAYDYNTSLRTHNAQLYVRFDLPFTQVSGGVRYSDDELAFVQSARGTVGLDSRSGTVLLDNRNWVTRGGLTIRPFLDVNGNGMMEPGEPAVKNLDVQLNGGRKIPSRDSSVTRIVDLQPYTPYYLSTSNLNLESLTWTPKYKSYSITVDANQFKDVLIPIIQTGDMMGTVRYEGKEGTKGLAGIKIIVIRKDVAAMETTLSTGGGDFLFSNLVPGRYTAYIDDAQMKKLSLTSDPPSRDFRIESREEGDIVDHIDFLLQPVAEPTDEEGRK